MSEEELDKGDFFKAFYVPSIVKGKQYEYEKNGQIKTEASYEDSILKKKKF